MIAALFLTAGKYHSRAADHDDIAFIQHGWNVAAHNYFARHAVGHTPDARSLAAAVRLQDSIGGCSILPYQESLLARNRSIV